MEIRHRVVVAGCAVLFAAALWALPATARDKVEAEWRQSENVDVADFHTYTWRRGKSLPEEGPLAPDGAADREIRRAGDRLLEQKGYEPAADAKPELVIVYHVIPEDRLYVEGEGYKLGRWVTLSTAQPSYRSFTRGTLLVDVVDAETDELIWTGWVSKLARDQKDLQRVLGGGIKAILGHLPERSVP